MRQAYEEYDDHHTDAYGLVGEERAEEAPPRNRRLPMVLLSVCLMALFSGGLYFAYVQGTRHPAVVAKSGDGVPLLRADERPTKVRPDQPGGMAIPDQNVSLYNEKPGGPPVERLLPAPEQPLPRPAPAAQPAAPPPAAGNPAGVTEPGAPAAADAAPPAPQPAGKTAAKPPAPPKVATPAASPGKSGPVQVRLASVRTPEAAREEWAKLKRENADLLGKLTAVAVRTDLGEKGIYYRIQAGSFGDAAAAEQLCSELKRRNLGCLLAR